jgi:hypothetical protein
MPKKNNAKLETSTIDQYLRLAHAPPDEVLLRRYFTACEGKKNASSLTGAERRWATVNLEANPVWQHAWAELEKEAGKAVDWQFHALSPKRSAVILTAGKDSRATVLLQSLSAFVERFRFFQPQWAFRYAIAAALVFAVLYGSLWLAGKQILPRTYELASVDAYHEVLSVEIRGESSAATREFSSGAAALLAAHRDWLGLFPHFDQAQADTAIAHFHRAFEAANDPFQRAEIAFFLAKAYLMKTDFDHAKQWLEKTLAQNVADYREEARLLLEKLQRGN